VSQGAKESEGEDEDEVRSAGEITPGVDGNDPSRFNDEIPLSGEEAGKEEGEEEKRAGDDDIISLSGTEEGEEEGEKGGQGGRSFDVVTPPGNNEGEGERKEEEEKRAGDDDENMEANAESG
jgi:hypothetical protein